MLDNTCATHARVLGPVVTQKAPQRLPGPRPSGPAPRSDRAIHVGSDADFMGGIPARNAVPGRRHRAPPHRHWTLYAVRMGWISSPEAWIALVTLTVLEIVLG